MVFVSGIVGKFYGCVFVFGMGIIVVGFNEVGKFVWVLGGGFLFGD